MEQEEDKAVQKFEENNEINFKLNEKVEKSKNMQNVRFFGIANEQTKFLGKFFLRLCLKNFLKKKWSWISMMWTKRKSKK